MALKGRETRPFSGHPENLLNVPRPLCLTGRPIGNPNAYNCHSYAWHNSKGDPGDPRNKNLVDLGITKWDNFPDDDIIEQNYSQLGNDDPNIAGDKVVYYIDKNRNGQLGGDESPLHSAIVKTVDADGNTKAVVGKMGQLGVVENHPRAPGYYDTNEGQQTSRAYFRPEQEKDEMFEPVKIKGQ